MCTLDMCVCMWDMASWKLHFNNVLFIFGIDVRRVKAGTTMYFSYSESFVQKLDKYLVWRGNGRWALSANGDEIAEIRLLLTTYLGGKWNLLRGSVRKNSKIIIIMNYERNWGW